MDRKSIKLKLYWLVTIILFSAALAWGGTSDELVAAYEQMRAPSLAAGRVVTLNDQTITQKDFSLHIDSGAIYLFDPLRIDSSVFEWGGLFIGTAEFKFTPSPAMEREQLKRFYDLDSLSNTVKEIELIGSSSVIDSLIGAGEMARTEAPERALRSLKDHHGYLIGKELSPELFNALKGIAFPSNEPFLLINVTLGKHGETSYKYDPYAREEVTLQKHYWEVGWDGFMETVCSYSTYSNGSPMTINGLEKGQVRVSHYDLNTRLDKNGNAFSQATMDLETLRPTQLLEFKMNSELAVDSIEWLNGGDLLYRRWTNKDHKSPELLLFFDRQLEFAEEIQLRVWSHGELLPSIVEGYVQKTGGDWYPHYGSDRATYEMKFVTPGLLTFVASGDPLSSKKYVDSLVTTWRVTAPVAHVSLAMADYAKYELLEPGAPAVEVYSDKMLRTQIASNQNEEQVVAQDLANCLKLFSAYYGPYQYPKLIGAELPGFHGQSFPGLVHLGHETFDATDREGYNRLLRAREVAHQWWGLSVDAATYHDAWLIEGLAEYSVMMYVQASTGNQRFFDILARYADSIFNVSQLPLGGGIESGPVTLGTRTSTSRSSGDYDLIVYKKWAWIFHMLRNFLVDLTTMSDQAFLDMMAEWYRTHKGGQVTTLEFIRHVSKYAGEDMSWFFNQYLYHSELPTYHFSYELTQAEDGRTRAVCHVSQEGVPDEFRMYIPLEIEFVSGQKVYLRLSLDQPEGDIELPPIDGAVKAIRLNPFRSVLCRVKS